MSIKINYSPYGERFPGVGLGVAAQDVNGNAAPILVDASGKVLIAGAGTGGTSDADETGFTAGVTAGNPIMGVVDPIDTLADGVLAIVALDNQRRIKVAGTFSSSPVQSNTSSAPAQTTVGTTAGQVLAANASRKRFSLQNVGTTIIKIVLGAASPTQSIYHFSLAACGQQNDGSSPVYIDTMWTGAIQAISSAAGGLLLVTELT